jgi:hypothetical protein
VARLDDVLDDDDLVVVRLSEAAHIPHRGAAALIAGIDVELAEHIQLLLPFADLALGQRMIGAFGAGDQDVSGWVAARVDRADIGAIVIGVRGNSSCAFSTASFQWFSASLISAPASDAPSDEPPAPQN